MGYSVCLHSFLFFLLQVQFNYSYHSPSLLTFSSHKHNCHHRQSLALLHFKQSLRINISASPYCQNYVTYPKTISWNENIDCCTWDGVDCDEITGHVTGLDLSCSQLHGPILSHSSLFQLPHLQRLNLTHNDFSDSSIPSEIIKLARSLTHLNLSTSRFSGEIPSEISYLSKLVSLDLSQSTRYKYHILKLGPPNFRRLLQNLTSLQELSLAKVNILSGLPTNISSSLTHLTLSDTGLLGKLPDEILCLPNLQELDLSSNKGLTGYFPVVNGQNRTCPIRRLDLSRTGLSGEILDSIGNLNSLCFLNLSNCQLSGPIPRSLRNLKELVKLDLSNNKLSGSIPYFKDFNGLQNLTNLDMSSNSLKGMIPSWLFTLPSLRSLHLQSNHLSQLDEQNQDITSSKSLQVLVLSLNDLQGPFPQSVLQLVNLNFLYLSSNNLTGVLDMGILLSKLTNLHSLSLSNNPSLSVGTRTSNYITSNLKRLYLASCKITQFPSFLRSVKNLEKLDLSNNRIRGQIPNWAGAMWRGSLSYLNLSHNFLTGLQYLLWKHLSYLFLRSNFIEGPLPPSICNMSNLRILDLSHNSFRGAILPCLGNMSNRLSVLDLRMNAFHGSIQTTFTKCKMLKNVNFNGNLLEGRMPRSFADCQSLQVLDLGNNQLNDAFPHWLETLPKLKVLVLRSNKFHGPIRSTASETKSPFPQLRIIDISHNGFTGPLPRNYLENFKAMRNVRESEKGVKYMGTNYYHYIVTVATKGLEIELTRILTIFTTIDLSSNNFEGEISYTIGYSNSFQVLNLSHNTLTGQIPSLLGNLSAIESLDLSSNQLAGEIPQHLAALTFLAVLNLSQNHLEGHIPQGQQFNTFQSDSYKGNPALCGFPLPKECVKGDSQQPKGGEEDDSDTAFGFTWEVVLLGYGCGTIFGLVLGYLMFLTGRPKWFNGIVEVEERRILKRWKN